MTPRFPVCRVRFTPSHRLVSSRFPPRGLFDRVADPADLEATIAVESLTNDRLRDEVGNIALVPPGERMTGPGATPIMAALTHPSPLGSRFSDGSFGVYYAARDLGTAIRESVHHRERWLAESAQPPITLEMRAYQAEISGRLDDLRGNAKATPLLDPDHYAAAQRFGIERRHAGGHGIVHPSVRNPGGECAAVFRTAPLRPARQAGHYGFVWNGMAITDVIELRASGISPHSD
ncbi:MAG: RES family NAD+ phosphorylase [Halofilum sp. (in: g-proteobacteria)]